MSRGLGRIERFIVDSLKQRGEAEGFAVIVSSADLAKAFAGEPGDVTAARRGSIRRAINRLGAAGRVRRWSALLPTFVDQNGTERAYRSVLCVSLPGVESSDAAGQVLTLGHRRGASESTTKSVTRGGKARRIAS